MCACVWVCGAQKHTDMCWHMLPHAACTTSDTCWGWQHVLTHVATCHHMLHTRQTCQHMSTYAKHTRQTCQHMSTYDQTDTNMWQNTSTHVSTCLHMVTQGVPFTDEPPFPGPFFEVSWKVLGPNMVSKACWASSVGPWGKGCWAVGIGGCGSSPLGSGSM